MKNKKIIIVLLSLFILTSSSVLGNNITKKIEPKKDIEDNITDDSVLTEEEINKIKENATAESWPFKVGRNAATSRSLSQLCGFVEPGSDNSKSKDEKSFSSSSSLPDKFDFREKYGYTSIKDQEQCGSCWAFGTIGAIESAIMRKEGVEVDLSEQWLVSCNVDGWGCNGGWWAHDYFFKEPVWHENYPRIDPCGGTGAVLEEESPYKSGDWEDTGYVPGCNCPYDHFYYLNESKYVAGEHEIADVESIKQAIYNYGPVSTSVRVNDAFITYNGGVFNQHEDGNTNHAVVIMGWDDNQGSNGVWFLRNSWGPSWGESADFQSWDENEDGILDNEGGYMRIEYGCCSIGYATRYVDYESSNLNKINLKININRIKALDMFENETDDEADFSYKISVKDEEWHEVVNDDYSTNNDDREKEVSHDFNVTKQQPLIRILVWDRDNENRNYADVSSYEGGGGYNPDMRGITFYAKYDLLTHELVETGSTIDDFSKQNGSYIINGEDDGGEGDENDCKLWFSIEDDYNLPDAEYVGVTNGVSGNTIRLKGKNSGGVPPFSYSWDADSDGRFDDGYTKMLSHAWKDNGDYEVKFKVTDGFGMVSSDSAIITIDKNHPPQLYYDGPSEVVKDEFFDLTFRAEDPEGDDVYYWVEDDWDYWKGPYGSGECAEYGISSDGPGRYKIGFKAKAKDEYGLESETISVKITVSKEKMKSYSMFFDLFDFFPILKRCFLENFGLFKFQNI